MDNILKLYLSKITSPDSYRPTMLRIALITTVILGLVDVFAETFTFIATSGTRGQVEPLKMVIVLLIILGVYGLDRASQLNDLIAHAYLFSHIVLAIIHHQSYNNFLLTNLLLALVVISAGLLTRPLFSIIYAGLSYLTVLVLSGGELSLNMYENLIILFGYLSALSFLFSWTIQTAFQVSREAKQTITELYNDNQKMFRNLAHRTKTPLTVLKTELRQRCKTLPQKDKERVLESLMQIENSITEFTKISKVKFSELRTVRHTISLTKLLADLVKDGQILAANYFETSDKQRTVHWIDKKTPQNAMVYIDEERFREALLNVIDNSIRHSPDRETVNTYVTLRKKGGSYSIWISDDGVGMPEDRLKDILSNRSPEDTGGQHNHIGLQIVRNIVRANDGEIHIYAQEQKGTRVEILLPAL